MFAGLNISRIKGENMKILEGFKLKDKSYALNIVSEIIKDLEAGGYSDYCPDWSSFFHHKVFINNYGKTSEYCIICMNLFPNKENICPCNSELSTEFLIQRLKQIKSEIEEMEEEQE